MRLSTMVKPFWFVLAGYFAVGVRRRARELALRADEPRAARRNAGTRARAPRDAEHRGRVADAAGRRADGAGVLDGHVRKTHGDRDRPPARRRPRRARALAEHEPARRTASTASASSPVTTTT